MSEENKETGVVTTKRMLTKAYLLGDGSVIPAKELEAFRKSQKMDSASGQDKKSEEMPGDLDWNYLGEELIAPPYNMEELVGLLERCTDHFRCVKAKADDVTGLFYRLIPKEGVDPGDKQFLEDRQKLKEFFDRACPNSSFIEMMTRVQFDYESVGSGFFEVTRDISGVPSHLYHVPASTIRIKKNGLGFVQKIGEKKIHFLPYGTKYHKEDGGHKPALFIDPETGKIIRNMTKVAAAESATEIIQLCNYHPKSPFYGLPDVVPALSALVGNICAAKYNISFFENNAIPACIITIKGADLSPELEAAIKEFFSIEIKGKPHRSLTIPVPFDDVEVTVTPLDVNIKDQSFTLYKRDNRDEVLRAHGVHPARIGIIERGALAADSGLSQAENYKNSVVEPSQHKVETRITDLLIRDGFGIETVVFKFQDLDIRDKEKESRLGLDQVKAGCLTVNEFRTEILGKDPVYGGDDPFVLTSSGPLFLKDLAESPDASETSKAVKKLTYRSEALESILGDLEEKVNFLKSSVS